MTAIMGTGQVGERLLVDSCCSLVGEIIVALEQPHAAVNGPYRFAVSAIPTCTVIAPQFSCRFSSTGRSFVCAHDSSAHTLVRDPADEVVFVLGWINTFSCTTEQDPSWAPIHFPTRSQHQ